MSMAEELLPTNVKAILVSDPNVTILAYRLLRDGMIPSNRVLVRNILTGSGKNVTCRLLQNLGLWSTLTRNIMRSSAAILHSFGPEEKRFPYVHSTAEAEYMELKESEDESKNPLEENFAQLAKQHQWD